MRWETADPWELGWVGIGLLGMLAVMLLWPLLIREARLAHRSQVWLDRVPVAVDVALNVISLTKLSMCLALGWYTLGQPPSGADLSETLIRIRVGFMIGEILIALPPWLLYLGRQIVRRVDARQQPRPYLGPERRKS